MSLPQTSKKFINAAVAALNTPVASTDDDTGETTFILDRDHVIVDLISEADVAAGVAGRWDLESPPKSTGISWHLSEIKSSTQGRVRKGNIVLKGGRKYRYRFTQTLGAVLGAGAANIILTLQAL